MTSQPYHTLEGFPVYNWNNIPSSQSTEYLSEQLREKPWKNCENCGASPALVGHRLRRCRRCAWVRCMDPARYCTAQCAREDWPKHRWICENSVSTDKSLQRHYMDPEVVEFEQLERRQGHRWIRALQAKVFIWVCHQAFQWCSFQTPKEICLHIQLESIDPTNPQSPVRPVSFEFRPMQGNIGDDMPADLVQGPPESSNYGNFAFTINEHSRGAGYATLYTDPNLHPIKKSFPQWPFIFAQVALMGNISPVTAHHQLRALCHTIDTRPDLVGEHLKAFIVPRFTTKWILSDEMFHRWMQVMYPVAAGLESRFHKPCDYLERTYGHLLRQSRETNTDDGEEWGTHWEWEDE